MTVRLLERRGTYPRQRLGLDEEGIKVAKEASEILERAVAFGQTTRQSRRSRISHN